MPPWTDQEARVAKGWVAIEALAISFVPLKCGSYVRRSFSSLRRAARAISQLLDVSRWCHLEG